MAHLLIYHGHWSTDWPQTDLVTLRGSRVAKVQKQRCTDDDRLRSEGYKLFDKVIENLLHGAMVDWWLIDGYNWWLIKG